MKKIFGLLALATIFGAAGIARADIAPPRDLKDYKLDPPKATGQSAGSGQFSIVQSSDTDVIRLQIPKSVVAQLQAQTGAAPKIAGMTSEATRTLFAGLFLSIGLAVGGVWVLRSRKSAPARAAAMLMIALAMAGTATTAVWANAGPPGRVIFPPGTLPKALKHDASLDGTVVYEVVDDGNIRLIIPTDEIKRAK